MNSQGLQNHQSIPNCVQNAMLTKDKKPFTYTPGGIDLSQIKSERMAKRLARNAMDDNQAYTQPSKQNSSEVPKPPPPPKLPQMGPNHTNVEGKPRKPPVIQSMEPPPLGFRPKIDIPPNPMAKLKKVPPPVEKNTFWKDEYLKEHSDGPTSDIRSNLNEQLSNRDIKEQNVVDAVAKNISQQEVRPQSTSPYFKTEGSPQTNFQQEEWHKPSSSYFKMEGSPMNTSQQEPRPQLSTYARSEGSSQNTLRQESRPPVTSPCFKTESSPKEMFQSDSRPQLPTSYTRTDPTPQNTFRQESRPMMATQSFKTESGPKEVFQQEARQQPTASCADSSSQVPWRARRFVTNNPDNTMSQANRHIESEKIASPPETLGSQKMSSVEPDRRYYDANKPQSELSNVPVQVDRNRHEPAYKTFGGPQTEARAKPTPFFREPPYNEDEVDRAFSKLRQNNYGPTQNDQKVPTSSVEKPKIHQFPEPNSNIFHSTLEWQPQMPNSNQTYTTLHNPSASLSQHAPIHFNMDNSPWPTHASTSSTLGRNVPPFEVRFMTQFNPPIPSGGGAHKSVFANTPGQSQFGQNTMQVDVKESSSSQQKTRIIPIFIEDDFQDKASDSRTTRIQSKSFKILQKLTDIDRIQSDVEETCIKNSLNIDEKLQPIESQISSNEHLPLIPQDPHQKTHFPQHEVNLKGYINNHRKARICNNNQDLSTPSSDEPIFATSSSNQPCSNQSTKDSFNCTNTNSLSSLTKLDELLNTQETNSMLKKKSYSNQNKNSINNDEEEQTDFTENTNTQYAKNAPLLNHSESPDSSMDITSNNKDPVDFFTALKDAKDEAQAILKRSQNYWTRSKIEEAPESVYESEVDDPSTLSKMMELEKHCSTNSEDADSTEADEGINMTADDQKTEYIIKLNYEDKLLANKTCNALELPELRRKAFANSCEDNHSNESSNFQITTISIQSESEIEEDSGVIDVNRVPSETDTEMEILSAKRKRNYQRTATHSRLFHILQHADESLKNNQNQIEKRGPWKMQKGFKPGQQNSYQQRRSLFLSFGNNGSIDADNPSTPNSPASSYVGKSIN